MLAQPDLSGHTHFVWPSVDYLLILGSENVFALHKKHLKMDP